MIFYFNIYFLTQLENEVLHLYLILDVFSLSYDHNDVYEWFSTCFLPRDLDVVSDSSHLKEKSGTIIQLISKIKYMYFYH